MKISIQTEDFDFGAEVSALRLGNPQVGAVAAFVGAVRDLNDDACVELLELEHYPEMSGPALRNIVEAALARFEVRDASVIHRVGPLRPTDQIVMVAVAGAHRQAAFAAAEFIMDYLKTDAPFWKKETGADGSHWVRAREADQAARARWNVGAGKGANRNAS